MGSSKIRAIHGVVGMILNASVMQARKYLAFLNSATSISQPGGARVAVSS